MATTLLAKLRPAALEGRDAELEELAALLGDGTPAAIWVHGIAGSGKSALLRAFAQRHPSAVVLDARTVEPTESGFLAGLSKALGESIASVEDAAEALDGVVLAIDAYHKLGLIDSWMRLTLLPALPATARLLIASREAPLPAWHAELGPLLRTLPLGPLAPAAAEAVLRRAGRSAEEARAINRFAHGHPLSLVLAANARELPTVFDTLARLYLDGLDPATRRALDAASATRRTTLSLLAALLPDDAPHEAFERLRALPFTEMGADGLVVDDAVRETVAAMLRAGDPATHRRLKIAAWCHLREEMRDAAPRDLWRYTADMLYLIENTAIRDIYFPTTAPQHAFEPARPEDWDGIEAICALHEPAEMVAVIRRYWEHIPERFTVARDAAGDVHLYHLLFTPREISPRVIDADPLASAWREHLRRDPLAPGQVALCIRAWGWLATGEATAAGQASICLDVKRTWLELRPALARAYLHVRELEDGLEKLSPLAFVREPRSDAQVGGAIYHGLVCELGAASFDGWLADMGARELHLHERSPLDELDLTRLERGVLHHLHVNQGRVVSRAELFRAVWGTDHLGDGNALEAVVSALRRKLGPRAKALETVRGAGYRLRDLS